jgi:hypothetical protein
LINGTGLRQSYSLHGDQTSGFAGIGNNNLGLQFVTVDVIFGRNNSTLLVASDEAQALANGASTFSEFAADFGNTLSWQGITGLTVGGVAVTDYSAVSADTGFNFRQGLAAPAVPEPASWALMIAGFGLTGAALRRRAATVRVSYS